MQPTPVAAPRPSVPIRREMGGDETGEPLRVVRQPGRDHPATQERGEAVDERPRRQRTAHPIGIRGQDLRRAAVERRPGGGPRRDERRVIGVHEILVEHHGEGARTVDRESDVRDADLEEAFTAGCGQRVCQPLPLPPLASPERRLEKSTGMTAIR